MMLVRRSPVMRTLGRVPCQWPMAESICTASDSAAARAASGSVCAAAPVVTAGAIHGSRSGGA